MISYEAHGEQLKSEIKNRIVWVAYGITYVLSHIFSLCLLYVFWLFLIAMLDEKEYFLSLIKIKQIFDHIYRWMVHSTQL